MNCLARSESEMKHFSLLTFNQEAKIFLLVFFFFNIDLFAGSSLLHGLSLVAASGEYSLVPVCGLLVMLARGLQSAGSVVLVHRLSSSPAGKVFPDRWSNPCPCVGRWILNHWITREVSPALERWVTGFHAPLLVNWPVCDASSSSLTLTMIPC